MGASAVPDQKTVAREALIQKDLHASAVIPASAGDGNTTSAAKIRRDYALEPAAEKGFYEPTTSLLSVTQVDAAKLIKALRQLEAVARRDAPRIAFKAKGRILFLYLAEIVAVQAEGNYVSLRHRPIPYLLRESISSIAEKLKPYGFIRIHRSVVVNISAVEEIQPLPTGEYRLRVKDGKEYTVTRTYKDNLRDLAQLWVG
jgi:two-component system LytT family response regulator